MTSSLGFICALLARPPWHGRHKPGRARPSVISEEIRWPSVGISDGRQWGFPWPPLWSFSWPPTQALSLVAALLTRDADPWEASQVGEAGMGLLRESKGLVDEAPRQRLREQLIEMESL